MLPHGVLRPPLHHSGWSISPCGTVGLGLYFSRHTPSSLPLFLVLLGFQWDHHSGFHDHICVNTLFTTKLWNRPSLFSLSCTSFVVSGVTLLIFSCALFSVCLFSFNPGLFTNCLNFLTKQSVRSSGRILPRLQGCNSRILFCHPRGFLYVSPKLDLFPRPCDSPVSHVCVLVERVLCSLLTPERGNTSRILVHLRMSALAPG